MVNREVGELYPKVAVPAGALLLDVRGLGRARAYQGIDLQVRRGEIVGLTGLVGSGAKELLRSLFGLAPPDSGEVRLDGQPLSLRSPREAVAQGVALMPEERRRQGVALDLSVQENTTLAALSRFVRLGLLSPARERHTTLELIERLRIKALARMPRCVSSAAAISRRWRWPSGSRGVPACTCWTSPALASMLAPRWRSIG